MLVFKPENIYLRHSELLSRAIHLCVGQEKSHNSAGKFSQFIGIRCSADCYFSFIEMNRHLKRSESGWNHNSNHTISQNKSRLENLPAKNMVQNFPTA